MTFEIFSKAFLQLFSKLALHGDFTLQLFLLFCFECRVDYVSLSKLKFIYISSQANKQDFFFEHYQHELNPHVHQKARIASNSYSKDNI
jgi:hypothetical protein